MFDSVMDYVALCTRVTIVIVVSLLAVLLLLYIAFGLGFLVDLVIQRFGW